MMGTYGKKGPQEQKVLATGLNSWLVNNGGRPLSSYAGYKGPAAGSGGSAPTPVPAPATATTLGKMGSGGAMGQSFMTQSQGLMRRQGKTLLGQ